MHLSSEEDKNIKILIVEDESIVALDLARNLNQLGFYSLPPVNTGDRAIASVVEQNPDLIILDIKIKGDIDGIETAQRIKTIATIPFIFFSAFSDEETLERVKETKPYGYIPKNSTSIDLYTTVKIALQRFSIEKAMHTKENILSVTLESISDAVIGIDRNGKIISWNRGATEIFGWTVKDSLMQDISILTPSFIPNEFPGMIELILKSGKVNQFDSVCQNKAGKLIHVSISLFPISSFNDGEIPGISLVIKDISEKKELEKQINDILEEDRQRIGQDLHDNLGQYLTGILLKLKVLENNLGKKNLITEKDLAARISSHVKIALESTRELARDLITPGMNNLTLYEALDELTTSFSGVQKLQLECDKPVSEQIKDNRVISQLYHIAQESITNAMKHSDCSIITLTIDCDETEIILKIKDNGRGIEYSEYDGLGLKIMKYRANIINGRLTVYGKPGQGTTVSCRVPKTFLGYDG